jgi:hypothetical protein
MPLLINKYAHKYLWNVVVKVEALLVPYLAQPLATKLAVDLGAILPLRLVL